MQRSLSNRYVITTQCEDTIGIVAKISGFLSDAGCTLTEAQHFNDADEKVSFVRMVFQAASGEALCLEELAADFEQAVARRFRMRIRVRELDRRLRVVIAVSKQGHCLASLLQRWMNGSIPIDIVAVVSNHQNLRSFVEWHGVKFHYLPIVAARKLEQERCLNEIFHEAGGELLVLARYMQVLSAKACDYFVDRAINIHHSFLPSFVGSQPYQQAYARGVKLIGATAHYVTAELDEGPIIEQSVERVDHALSADQLAVIGSDVECVVLNRAVHWHAECRVFRYGKRTIVLR